MNPQYSTIKQIGHLQMFVLYNVKETYSLSNFDHLSASMQQFRSFDIFSQKHVGVCISQN